MAKDDFFVIAYRIMAYLYACMKAGEEPDGNHISHEWLGIPKSYWNSIMGNLCDKGFIKGIGEYSVPGKDIYELKRPEITMDGIEYLQNNSTIVKAKAALKELKEMVPGF